MNEAERQRYKEELKNQFRKELLASVEEAERKLEELGKPMSRLEIVRYLRQKFMDIMQAVEPLVQLSYQEELQTRIAVYHELMDEFVRSATN